MDLVVTVDSEADLPARIEGFPAADHDRRSLHRRTFSNRSSTDQRR